MHQEIDDIPFDDLKIRKASEFGLHLNLVNRAITLSAGSAHRGSLAPIQQSELNPCPVRNPTHQAVECINLPYEVPLTQSADCGVTRHFANRVFTVCDESCLRS